MELSITNSNQLFLKKKSHVPAPSHSLEFCKIPFESQNDQKSFKATKTVGKCIRSEKVPYLEPLIALCLEFRGSSINGTSNNPLVTLFSKKFHIWN